MGINDNQSIGTRLDWINYMVSLSRNIDRISRTEYKLNVTQSRILIYVATHGVLPIGNVATALFLKASTITAAMDILEKKGFVERLAATQDKRHVCVQITDAGREVAPHYIFILQEIFGETAKHFKKDSYEELLAYVDKFNIDNQTFADHDIDGDVKALEDNLNSGLSKDELERHARRAFIIEVISCFLAKASIYDRQSNLSINEGRILRTLGNSKKGLRLSAISDSISIRPNVATVSVSALLDKDLVKRATDQYDRRAACVSLTRDGKKLLSVNNPGYCKMFDSIFPGLSEIDYNEYLA